jgi:hypothetical protein
MATFRAHGTVLAEYFNPSRTVRLRVMSDGLVLKQYRPYEHGRWDSPTVERWSQRTKGNPAAASQRCAAWEAREAREVASLVQCSGSGSVGVDLRWNRYQTMGYATCAGCDTLTGTDLQGVLAVHHVTEEARDGAVA